MSDPSFLTEPPQSPASQRLYDDDQDELGYVMNASRLWAYQPESMEALFALMGQVGPPHGVDGRRRALVVAASVSTLRDSYCSLMWGMKLAALSDDATAAGVLRGDDSMLDPVERAIVGWVRSIVRDPGATTRADVDDLRAHGLSEDEIFAITVFAALRLAFSTVNGALGAVPDARISEIVPAAVVAAVDYGRPLEVK